MSSLNGSLATFRDGRRGFFGDNNALTGLAAGPHGALVFDDTSVQSYPTAPQTQGVWYGTGTEASIVATGASAPSDVCIGNSATVTAGNAVAVGSHANAVSGGVAVGFTANANATNCTAIGLLASCGGTDEICIGHSATAGTTANYSIAIGTNTSVPATFTDCIVIGRAATAAQAGDVCIGNGAVSGGAGHPLLTLGTSFAVTTAAAGASDNYLPIRINGVDYKLLLHS